MITITRYHDCSIGHRVHGHESKCRHLHGHNYRIHFTCAALPQNEALDSLGRVIDFSVIKTALCEWLEETWDHKMLLWERDPMIDLMEMGAAYIQQHPRRAPSGRGPNEVTFITATQAMESIVAVPFNPTAENMAEHLLKIIGPERLAGTGVWLVRVVVEETRKCSAVASIDDGELYAIEVVEG